MNFIKTFLSPSFFGLAALCFLLPFLEIKCTDKVLVSASGVELMTGKGFNLESPGDMLGEESKAEKSPKESKDIAPQPMMIITFLLSMVGIAVAFFSFRQKNVTSAILGFLGFLVMLIFKFTFESQMASAMSKTDGSGNSEVDKSAAMMREMIKVEFAPAFYGCLVLLLAAGVLGIYLKSNEVIPDENADLRAMLMKEQNTILDSPEEENFTS
jgi:hypothetical protein